jgi:hypothetical protein
MCNSKNKKKNEYRIRSTAEKIFAKRYFGIIDDHTPMWNSPLNPTWSDDEEINKFRNNFSYSLPVSEKILFTDHLLEDLKECAKENNVELSLYINCLLLQMLERNQRTEEHTKGKRAYITNNLYIGSNFSSYAETLEEFSKNILDKDFIKYGEIKYKEKSFNKDEMEQYFKDHEYVIPIHEENERIYIINYLLNNGYSLEQIENIEKEENEYLNSNGHISVELYLKDIDHIFEKRLSISTRLGLHYILLETTNLKTYDSIENFLNSKLEGDKKVWNLYQDYLNEKLI